MCVYVRACVRACVCVGCGAFVGMGPAGVGGRAHRRQSGTGGGRVVLWTVGLQGAGGMEELRPRDSDRDPLRPGLVVVGVQ